MSDIVTINVTHIQEQVNINVNPSGDAVQVNVTQDVEEITINVSQIGMKGDTGDLSPNATIDGGIIF